MLKAIGGVVIGYVAMFICVFTLFTLAYTLLGANGAFQPGSYDVSGTWLVIAVAVSALAALVGGFVCKAIARSSGAALALAGLVLVLGVVSAIIGANKTVPPVRAANVGNIEAMNYAKTPTWMMLLMPVIGAAGVLVGARLKSE